MPKCRTYAPLSEFCESNATTATNDIFVNRCNKKRSQNFVANAGVKFYNVLPEDVKKCISMVIFKFKLRNFLTQNPCYSFDEFFSICE